MSAGCPMASLVNNDYRNFEQYYGYPEQRRRHDIRELVEAKTRLRVIGWRRVLNQCATEFYLENGGTIMMQDYLRKEYEFPYGDSIPMRHYMYQDPRMAYPEMRVDGSGQCNPNGPYTNEPLRGEQVQIKHPKCESCKKEHKTEPLDCFGRCPNKQKTFWEKVRKLYWQRHLELQNV